MQAIGIGLEAPNIAHAKIMRVPGRHNIAIELIGMPRRNLRIVAALDRYVHGVNERLNECVDTHGYLSRLSRLLSMMTHGGGGKSLSAIRPSSKDLLS